MLKIEIVTNIKTGAGELQISSPSFDTIEFEFAKCTIDLRRGFTSGYDAILDITKKVPDDETQTTIKFE